MADRWTVQLNNYLQERQALHILSWDELLVGPPGNREWQMTCVINGESKGVGVAATKGAAKNKAAKEALAAMGQPV
ncbi:hypothetical protein L226DRAFT_575643 [Lentinus tigrinus ALCF2SS1-7]|uniref:DRBM domain-containing protein n=1 Tax=Lentinus tigrinus ALCF2SS1-6 TaxID=1328759 RepID=A0A5C2RS78_9APHY|nr:hypothetical protein L227DRAFT_657524 [Lentinus tigrinus ALCF2SS1-6]RPD69323.1 hypothetical protein L226DRAFT_575643 [Lentinus tigrinus ALCF2SS1-7]